MPTADQLIYNFFVQSLYSHKQALLYEAPTLLCALCSQADTNMKFSSSRKCFTFFCLIFFTEVTTTRFITGQGINTHQFTKFNKISNAACFVQFRIKIIDCYPSLSHPSRILHVKLTDFNNGFFQTFLITRHSTFIPHNLTQTAVE